MPQKRTRKPFVHPLEPTVRAVFAKRSPLDRITLAVGMIHPDPFTTDLTAPLMAYRKVAQHVLTVMLDQGKVTLDDLGWYYLV